MHTLQKKITAMLHDLTPTSGVLEKYNHNVFKDKYDARLVELIDCQFYYYKQEKEGNQLMGCLNFDLYECELNETEHESRKGFCLTVKGLESKKWSFRAVDPTDN